MRVTKSRPTAISVPAVFSLFVTIFKYIGTVLDGWIYISIYKGVCAQIALQITKTLESIRQYGIFCNASVFCWLQAGCVVVVIVIAGFPVVRKSLQRQNYGFLHHILPKSDRFWAAICPENSQ